jgi:hypothetical protein|nr:MAG TPA: Putative type VI secretion protein, baseplate, complex, STRUCTURAL PROTEIN.7A [Caudoviricetes sp.]
MIETILSYFGRLTEKQKQEAAGLAEDIQFFCNTPKGSLPLMRNYGIDYTILDQPAQVIKRNLTVDIVTGIRAFFGIQVLDILVEVDQDGHIKTKIQLGGKIK